MKIKIFSCNNITPEGLAATEKEINTFLAERHIVDIKINSICDNFGLVFLYTVLYKED